MPDDRAACDRRKFLHDLAKLPCATLLLGVVGPLETLATETEEGEEYYAMGIQVDRCIGCGLCVQACKTENDVPQEPYFFRTWVEHYEIHDDGSATVESPEGGIHGFPPGDDDRDVLRSFFVPKLCNQCDNPPCVQVCPVGATFKTEDGVVLVDQDYCIGCRYCIQACPYGARYLDPRTKTADKCTFCYHRITKGLLPACVEVCPTQARVFGELGTRSSPLHRMKRQDSLHVLKPSLNTEPKVLYANLDGEVR
ncbi:MAG: 4Fe-4S dicluster domain-containing protein [Acidobacteria bacterium]|nr:4Fe-4S dicluster domain-containing protein [Acidobacteriota bacterium]NIM61717.1 4Fe-4S dicluster domain-containing protein [Acidobacteriota bacterium]NIO58199.1 4Fe-4S dicluster domain-containing protein [Acidobacteriota bacterium]NIQ83764.1 4Fe-4S dicluster domain-containing protein [Acidobacteriota bacterium]NIT09927.1 4Fe-4S dicluster domain-containing protein [Acidobacteriota bacterium]